MTVTKGKVEAELQNRNYWQYTLSLAPPITETPVITPITTTQTPPATVTPFFEQNKMLMMILFVGAFLLAIFPGQTEGGSNV